MITPVVGTALMSIHDLSLTETEKEALLEKYGYLAEWTEEVSDAMKGVFKHEMVMGVVKNWPKAKSDFARNVIEFPDWMSFDNGKTTNDDGSGGYGKILDHVDEYFPCLKPFKDLIEEFQDPFRARLAMCMMDEHALSRNSEAMDALLSGVR